MSLALPEDIFSGRVLSHYSGLENAEIVRPAYAIEYDCVDPTTLKPSLLRASFEDGPCSVLTV